MTAKALEYYFLFLFKVDKLVTVFEIIGDMLNENLGVNAKAYRIPFPQLYQKRADGNISMWYGAWRADYPDPSNFLSLAYSGLDETEEDLYGIANNLGYHNKRFDMLYEMGMAEVVQERRLFTFQQADQLAMDDVALIPLFYGRSRIAYYPYVKNVYCNPMGHLDLSIIYLEKQ